MIHVLCGGIWLNAFNTIVIVSVLRTGGDVGAAAAIDVGSLWLIGVPAACVAGLLLKWDIALSTWLPILSRSSKPLWRCGATARAIGCEISSGRMLE